MPVNKAVVAFFLIHLISLSHATRPFRSAANKRVQVFYFRKIIVYNRPAHDGDGGGLVAV